MGKATEHIYIQDARDHLAEIWKWPDKKNARDFISQDLLLKNWNEGLSFSLYGNLLNLWKVKQEHEPLLKEIIMTLLIQKSVCEARLYLLAQCKAWVTWRWVAPLSWGPDIEFNSSLLKPNTDILRYEVLEQIFWKKINVRDMANKITSFTNSMPEWTIPLQVVEWTWKNYK